MRAREKYPLGPNLFLVCIFALWVMIPTMAGAAVYVVAPDGSGDYPTIQAAVDAAASYGDIIELTDGTFTGPGNRDILVSKDLTIRAQNGPTGYCIIDCQASQSDQHFGIEIDDNGGGAHLEGITIQNAWIYDFGGALHALTEGVFVVDSCIFWNNYAELGGGAIEAKTGCEIEINSCYFAGNRTNQYGPGGAIYAEDAVDVVINDCGFNGNWGDPGAIYISYNEATLTNCTINGSDGYGAAIYADNYAGIWVHNSIICFGDVAAVICAGSAGAVLYCCDIYGNAGGDWTGCIMSQYGVNGNISEDPLFCWPFGGSPFGLTENSPCAPEYNPSCGLIGAYEVDCGPATYSVQADGSGDYPTIQAAIDAVAEGSVIELTDGVYTGDGNRDLDFHGKPLTVCSESGHPSVCVINCEGDFYDPHRGLHFHSGEGPESVVKDIKIIGGFLNVTDLGAAILCEGQSAPTIDGCVLYGNTIPQYMGGGVACRDSSAATLIDCQFYNNDAAYGAGLYCWHSDVQVTDCSFHGNVAEYLGGGVFVQGGAPSFQGCTLVSNEAPRGGGLAMEMNAGTILTECDFEENTADYGAGLSVYGSHPQILDCTFTNNTATEELEDEGGGGIRLVGAQAHIEGCAFTSNTASNGGAVFMGGFSSNAEFVGCSFVENSAITGFARGGAIYSDGAEVSYRDTQFRSNESSKGGALCILGPGGTSAFSGCSCDSNMATKGGALYAEMTIVGLDSCRFAHNLAEHGGAAMIALGESHINESLFDQNWASVDGGAIHVWLDDATIHSCTLNGNDAPNGSGIYYDVLNSLPIYNTIIAFGAVGSAIGVSYQSEIPVLACTDVYGNAGGDWVGEIADQYGLDGNISLDPLFCGLENPEDPYTLESSSPCATENNPECGQMGAYEIGCTSGSGIVREENTISRLLLMKPFPNPSVADVRIGYAIPFQVQVRLQIVDAGGRLIRSLVAGRPTPGFHEISWDGRDQSGRRVDAGIYYCCLRTGQRQVAEQITVVR